jgi:hypothetical protein
MEESMAMTMTIPFLRHFLKQKWISRQFQENGFKESEYGHASLPQLATWPYLHNTSHN